MGLKETFQVLEHYAEHGVPLLWRGFDDEDETIQILCAHALLEQRVSADIHLIYNRFPELSSNVQKAILEKRWLIVSISKVVMSYGTRESKESVFKMLPYLQTGEIFSILTNGLDDESEEIQQRIMSELSPRIRTFIAKLHDRVLQSEHDEWEAFRAEIPQVVQALNALLARYDTFPNPDFVNALIECGEISYNTISAIISTKPYTLLYRSIKKTLIDVDSLASVSLLFRMIQGSGDVMHQLAVEIFKEKNSETFVPMIGTYLHSLDRMEFELMASRIRQQHWWWHLENVQDFDGKTSMSIVDYILICEFDEQDRLHRLRQFLRTRDQELAGYVLKKIREISGGDVLKECLQLLQSDNEDIQLQAIEFIIEIDPPDKVNILSPLLGSSNDAVSRLVMRVIAGESFSRYMKSFDSMNEKTRKLAAVAISKMDRNMTDRLMEEINSLDPERRIKAMQFIQFVNLGDHFESEIMDLINDADRRIRATAVRLMGMSGSVDSMRLLVSLLSDGDSRVRANVLEAFSDIGDVRFARLIRPFIEDADNRIRANALLALWNLGEKDLQQHVLAMLKHDQPKMRLSAVWLLKEMDMPEKVQFLEALQKVENNNNILNAIHNVLEES